MNYEYLRLTELVKKLNYSASTLNIYLSRAEFAEFRQGGNIEQNTNIVLS